MLFGGIGFENVDEIGKNVVFGLKWKNILSTEFQVGYGLWI